MIKVLTTIARSIVLLLLLVICTLIKPGNLFASDPTSAWTSTTSLPYLLASHVSFSSSDKVFVIGGSAVTGQSKLDVLTATPSADGSINSWTTTSLTPTALIFHNLAKKDNYVYILGGKEENPGSALDYVNKVYLGILNNDGIVTNWQLVNNLPEKRGLGAAVVSGNRIYYAGGRFNDAVTKSEVYYADINPDGTLGSWTTSSVSLPEPLFGFGMVENGNNLIIVGGFNGSVFRNKTYKATVNPDGTISAWTETSALPEPVYRAGVIRVGSELLTVGGHNGTNFLDKVYYTNIDSDGTLGAWQLSANHLPQPLNAGAVAFSNNYLYLTGGFNGTYLDTVYFTKISAANNILSVPYFSQNALPWGPSEYDHAKSLKISNPTMNNWGCAVTSAAMILNYHKMMELGDGTPIDPGSLNNWLKTHNGYATGKGKGGWYSSIIWSSIGTLTQNLYNANKAKYKLTPIPFSSHNKLNEDLALRNIAGETVGAPPIIKVTKVPLSFSHYVVPKGLTDNSVAINDPEWNYTDLTSFDNSDYTDLHRYIPSQTNLSSLYFVVNPDVEILVTDSQGRRTGKIFENGEIRSYDEIPNGIYTFEAPISNPNDGEESQQFGTGTDVFFLPTPPQGNYSVEISSNHEGVYTVNLATFKADGEFEVYKRMEAINATNTDDFEIQYSQTEPSIVTHAVTFDSFKEDIGALRDIREIKNFGTYVSLLAKAKIASAIGNTKPNATKAILMSILKELNAQRGKRITEEAYQILLYDVTFLKTHL